MPDDPTASIAANIISNIRRLSKRSAELKVSAQKNEAEASRLAEHIALLRQQLDRISKR